MSKKPRTWDFIILTDTFHVPFYKIFVPYMSIAYSHIGNNHIILLQNSCIYIIISYSELLQFSQMMSKVPKELNVRSSVPDLRN